MDPFTIAALIALAVAGSGAAAVGVVASRRASKRQAMREAVRAPVPCGSHAPVSVFDVFWDLGASEFALAMMAHRDVLLSDGDDVSRLVHTLGAEIERSGGRAAYIAEQLEAIEEYYRDHNAAGDRRKILSLAAPLRKMLPAAGATSTGSQVDVSYAGQITGGVADRDVWRSGGQVGPLSQGDEDNNIEVDVDAAVATDVQTLLKSLFGNGSILKEAKRWFAMRTARKLRDELDRGLEELHRIFAAHLRTEPQCLANLHDSARRWEAEGVRVAALKADATYKGQSWAMCADVLADEAIIMADALARTAHSNVDETLARIDSLATSNEAAMAGYLVYVNRYAFFAGHTGLCEAVVGRVDRALASLANELRRLGQQGVL